MKPYQFTPSRWLGWLGFGVAFLPFDSTPRPDAPDGLWCHTRIAPRWYWSLRRVCLFTAIVWRRYEYERIGWRTAWSVSECAKGLSR